MVKGYNKEILAAIDIGTTKICVLIANKLDNDTLEIIGVGKSASHGLSKGVVVDVAKTIYSIQTAIKEAELMAEVRLETVSIGISGAHISSYNSQGVVPISRTEIKEHDIAAVLAAAKAIPIPEGQHILHVLPQYYIIDGRDKVLDPIGMHGIRLEVQAHIIMGAISSVQNLVKCCQSAGVIVDDIILEHLASAHAVLSNDERTLGVGLLDIGGGTADLALYQQGTIRHTHVFPIAGNHFTNDTAIGLCTTLHEAEQIKKKYGIVHNHASKDDCIEIDMVQGEQKQVIHVSDLVRILEPRAYELFSLVHHEIEKRHLKSYITTGLVLTGGGSLLHGMQDVAEMVLDIPVRIGKPKTPFLIPQSLESPIYATGYGLLLHTMKKHQADQLHNFSGPLIKRVFYRMKTWMTDFF